MPPQATSPEPSPAEALFHQSNSALRAGHTDLAEACLREALLHDPNLAEAHANLALLLDQGGAPLEALQHYALAANLQPDNARIHLNHGALLAEQKSHDAAEAAYLRALNCDPALPGAWSNLGVLLALTWRDAEAEVCFRTALRLDDTHSPAHFNLACLLLRQGHFTEGWQHFETRNWYAAVAARLGSPRWQGESLTGKSILMVYEAGHGDMLQFCRYATLLRERGAAAVDLLCHPALKTLLMALDGVRRVIAYDEPWPLDLSKHQDVAGAWNACDTWVPVMSLPHLFQTRLDNIPAHLPYLRAPVAQAAHWQKALMQTCPRPLRRIGLVWQGSPAFENDAERSLPSLSLLAPLWQLPDLCFISLQKGLGEQELPELVASQPLRNVAPQLQNFADTAAVIAQLDLVITVDTAVAHLAGALGKPCWVLLPAYMTDWRWLEDRIDSPWYPGVMRLFRQTQGGGWGPVIAKLKEALGEWLTGTPLSAPHPRPLLQPQHAQSEPGDGSARSD